MTVQGFEKLRERWVDTDKIIEWYSPQDHTVYLEDSFGIYDSVPLKPGETAGDYLNFTNLTSDSI